MNFFMFALPLAHFTDDGSTAEVLIVEIPLGNNANHIYSPLATKTGSPTICIPTEKLLVVNGKSLQLTSNNLFHIELIPNFEELHSFWKCNATL